MSVMRVFDVHVRSLGKCTALYSRVVSFLGRFRLPPARGQNDRNNDSGIAISAQVATPVAVVELYEFSVACSSVCAPPRQKWRSR